MSENFDPYRTWLGIAKHEQPPSHYRLLGLDDFESDFETIRKAGEAKVQYLQDVSTGKHVAEAQQLLNQVAAAVVCLTNAGKKAGYDSQLAGNVLDTSSSNSSDAPAKPSEPPRKPAEKKLRRTNQSKSSAMAIGMAVVPLLLLAAVGAWWLMKGNLATKATDRNNAMNSTDKDGSWEPGKFVAADFTEVKGTENWSSPVGEWEFGEGVVINSSRDAGRQYLHMTGGELRTVTLRLSDEVDRKGILTVQAERWSDQGDFEFLVQQSVDGLDWTTIPREAYGDDYKKRAPAADGASWSVIYHLDAPEITQLRFLCNSKTLSAPKTGGILIGGIKIAPRIR